MVCVVVVATGQKASEFRFRVLGSAIGGEVSGLLIRFVAIQFPEVRFRV